jgi:RecA-family ATPase
LEGQALIRQAQEGRLRKEDVHDTIAGVANQFDQAGKIGAAEEGAILELLRQAKGEIAIPEPPAPYLAEPASAEVQIDESPLETGRAPISRHATQSLESWERALANAERPKRALAFTEAAKEVLRLATGPEERRQIVDDLYAMGVRHGLSDTVLQTLMGAVAPPPDEGELRPVQSAVIADQGPPLEILPFETFDASRWEGVAIEPRRWIAHNRIPVGEPGIMSGDGGTGKTKLALQLAVAVAACLGDWVGGVVDAEGPVIVFSAEEKLKEMHRRTLDVIESRGLSFGDLRSALHFICDQDETVLGAIDRNVIVQPTKSLLRLERTVAAIRPALVIVENAADVHAGNESDRPNVTRFMRSLLGRLTVSSEAALMLIQHPSVSGLNDGTGRSGSTAWNNSGRWRTNFTKVKDDAEGLRQLEIVKNNYGPVGEKVALRWERGVFVPEGADTSPRRAAADRGADELFLQLLEQRNAQGRWVTPNKALGFAPKELAAMPGAEGYTAAALANAMERLLAAQLVTVETFGPPSKQRQRLVVAPSNRLPTTD